VNSSLYSLEKLVKDLAVDQTHFYDILDIVIIEKANKERPKIIVKKGNV